MKKLFYNSIGKNTAVVTCENSSGIFKLHFQLSDNPVQHIWQNIHLNNKDIVTGIHQAEPFDALVNELSHCCVSVGVPPLSLPISQPQLNWLHREFVRHEKNDTWHRINHLIHIIENKIDNPLSVYDSSVLFFAENEQFIPLKDEFKLFLSSDVKWGRMNLGYGTLGKDWLDLAINDDDLLDLSIQKTISSETSLMFCPEPVMPVSRQERFYKWAKNTNIDVPLNDLNALSLGRYVLGQIIITDTLLEYHNIANDWYVPNHRCKLLWNKEVFVRDTKIIKIDFEDTDLMFESLLKHTEFGKLNVQ